MIKRIINLRYSQLVSEKGMTLFIAVVIMGLLLLISFAVINISLKATLFASSGRDSQYAFYAADSGLECALYWDSRHPTLVSAFGTSVSGSPINCGGRVIEDGDPIPGTTTQTMIGGGGPTNATSTFYFEMSNGNHPLPYCAIVTVNKRANGSTYIKSRGYNTCDPTHSRRVERGIEVTY
jgi:hypothetical protein